MRGCVVYKSIYKREYKKVYKGWQKYIREYIIHQESILACINPLYKQVFYIVCPTLMCAAKSH